MTADNIVKNEEEKEPINAAGETVCSVFFLAIHVQILVMTCRQ